MLFLFSGTIYFALERGIARSQVPHPAERRCRVDSPMAVNLEMRSRKPKGTERKEMFK